MLDWETVVQNKELLSSVEKLVHEADSFYSSPQEIYDELNRLTGNDWTADNYKEYCCDYDEWYRLDEVVFALFHGGHYPEQKNEDWKAWNKEPSIDVKKLYEELLVTFPEWEEDADSSESLFMSTNNQVYGFEKVILIRNLYKQKFLLCTLTNMNEQEKDMFVRTVQKYCVQVVED